MMHKVVEWIKGHPWIAGLTIGAVFLLVILLMRRGSSSSASSGTDAGTAAYLNSEAQNVAAGTALQQSTIASQTAISVAQLQQQTAMAQITAQTQVANNAIAAGVQSLQEKDATDLISQSNAASFAGSLASNQMQLYQLAISNAQANGWTSNLQNVLPTLNLNAGASAPISSLGAIGTTH